MKPKLWKSIAKYWAVFTTQLTNRGAYPLDLAAHSITILFFLFIFMQLWSATYRSSGQAVLAGLSLPDTLWYLMMAETIVLSKPRISRAISAAVKDGSIAYLMNKPYSFILYQASVGLGDNLVQLAGNLIFGGAITWLMVGPPPEPRGYLLVFPALVMGWLIDFCFNCLIGMAAFITEEVNAFDWIYQKILFILGGLLIPLDFYPAWLQQAARYLPFAYTVYGPARLFIDPSLERFVPLALGQMVWVLFLGALVGLVFRRSVRSLAVNGG